MATLGLHFGSIVQSCNQVRSQDFTLGAQKLWGCFFLNKVKTFLVVALKLQLAQQRDPYTWHIGGPQNTPERIKQALGPAKASFFPRNTLTPRLGACPLPPGYALSCNFKTLQCGLKSIYVKHIRGFMFMRYINLRWHWHWHCNSFIPHHPRDTALYIQTGSRAIAEKLCIIQSHSKHIIAAPNTPPVRPTQDVRFNEHFASSLFPLPFFPPFSTLKA